MNTDSNRNAISRREFLKAAGVGAAGVAAIGGAGALLSCSSAPSSIPSKWDYTADVVVVGTGAAASTVAVTARDAGASVIMLEKSAAIGGTSARSGGGYWIPNNFVLRAAGIQDTKEDCVRFMARAAYPQLYNAADERYGLPEIEYSLLAAFYDNAYKAVDFLAQVGALQSQQSNPPGLTDYVDHLPENKVSHGRAMSPRKADGTRGNGAEMMAQLSGWIKSRDIQTLTGRRVRQIYLNAKRQAIGVLAINSGGATPGTISVRANKAVVFGSGGFTHNPDLRLQFQLGPEYGGCAVIANEGDFVYAAQAIGAQLGNMTGAWHAEIPLEPALESPSTPNDIWQPAGDSMVLVNKYGLRVTNEKRDYNDRTKVHFCWDPIDQEYPNQIMLMIYDQRNRNLYAGSAGGYPIPPPNTTASHELSGQTWAELAQNVKVRISQIAGRIGSWRLDDSFEKNLQATIERFNGFANKGVDDDFHRGAYPYDVEWHTRSFSIPARNTKWQINDKPNVTMYPFQPQGPYYCILIAAGTLDTNGGPKTNEMAQVLDTSDNPIPGLYGAGNCIAAPTRYYFAGGCTLGPAIAYGYIAGLNAAKEPVKQT